MSKKILSLLFIGMCLMSRAQQMAMSEEPKMADTFREEGKIYVVITVIGLIFLALVAFLVYIERKVKKIEDKVNGI